MAPRLGVTRIGQTRVSRKAKNNSGLLHRLPAGAPAHLNDSELGLETFKSCSACRVPPCSDGRGCSFVPGRPLESEGPVLREVVWLLESVLALERRRSEWCRMPPAHAFGPSQDSREGRSLQPWKLYTPGLASIGITEMSRKVQSGNGLSPSLLIESRAQSQVYRQRVCF